MAKVAFDPFEALGLPRDASGSTIKARYHALALRYHPDRYQGSEQQKSTVSDHFHRVHEAYRLLCRADNRRRRAELLDLLDLQDEVLLHFAELVEQPGTPEEQYGHHDGADNDGHVSSDADEDLPNLGIQRRQTDLSRHAHTHGVRHRGDQPESPTLFSPTSPTKKRLQWPKLASISKVLAEPAKDADFFTKRRRKLKKLEKQEFEAFLNYRDAMVAKFKAEEEAEKQYELFERAKWKREYFERAPKETKERMRSFQHFMGAVSAFENHTPRQRNRSTVSYGNGTPMHGPGDSAHFLNPDSAVTRSKHQRGWSSDLSGDQTSSESDSGDAYAHKSRPFVTPGHWRHSSQGSNNVSLNPLRGRQSPTLNGHTDVPAAFQLVVRQPTGLSSVRETQSSSGEAPSPSSREPSPQPTGPNFYSYVLPSSETSQLLETLSNRRARSPSPIGRGQPSITIPRLDDHHTDGCSLELKKIGAPHHNHIPRQHVHRLNGIEKAQLLGAESDAVGAAAEAGKLLKRLATLDPSVAAKFEVKQDIKKSFNFRLIYGHKDIANQGHRSFIALSYRRKLQVEKTESLFTLPLEPEMFEAVWQEREDETEGLWIDQICIKQDSDFERTVSMSAMDMVYSSSRRVIVALDDIEFDAREGEQLQSHMAEYAAMTHVAPRQRFRRKQPSFLETHEHMFEMIRKILRSSWFKRAWCRHEMRLGKHHIFLIPCTRRNRPGRDVLRFNGKFMAHLLDLSLEVPFEPDVESVKPALQAFFRDRSKMAPDEREMASHHGNMSTVTAEVFLMEAGGDPRIPAEQREADARKDKVAIILNTMECGLALSKALRHPSVRLSQEECYRDLLLLGLAAQDPGSLCAIGSPLPISANSILYTPTVADAGLNNSKTLQRLPDDATLAIDTSGPEHYIQLDLKFLRPQERTRPQLVSEIGHLQDFMGATLDDLRIDRNSDEMNIARHIFSTCDEKKWGRNRKRYWTHDRHANNLFGPMHEIYVQTLACVLQCGPTWMSDIAQRYSMVRSKVDLPGAYDLLIALQNTCGKWPAEEWSERSAGFIVDFVNFLVIRGLPSRQLAKPEAWRPVWFATDAGGKVLSFVPTGNKNIKPAIPTALINPDYVHLARLWILEPRSLDSANSDEWTLLGKSVLFSDEVYIEHMSSSTGDLKAHQRIYGRRME